MSSPGNRTHPRRGPKAVKRGGFVAAALLVVTSAWMTESPATAERGEPAPSAPAPAAAPKPNVVLITADDMRPGDLQAMPFTRTLNQRGVRFNDAISPYTLCCPARAAIVTGQYSHNNGVRGNKWPNGGYWRLRGLKNTLPVWMREAGYRTAHVGKYLNGYEAKKKPPCSAAWCEYLDQRKIHAVPPGWGRWYGSIGTIYGYWGVRMRVGIGKQRSYETSRRYQNYFFSDIIRKRVIPAFRKADEQDDKPFFIWWSSATPHVTLKDSTWCGVHRGSGAPIPWSKDPSRPYSGAHWQRFKDALLPQGDVFQRAFNEDTGDKAGPMPAKTDRCRTEMRGMHRHRLASLLSLDDAIEKLVTRLQELGEWDNTVLIFTSDNGFALGEHRLSGKDKPYDSPLRVPMIVSGPGLKDRYQPGATAGVSPYTVTTLDIPATIVDIADASPGRPLDGISMMAPENNPDHGDGDRAVLIESGNGANRRTNRMQFAGVRTDRWTWFGWDAQITNDGLAFDVLDRYRKVFEFYDRRTTPSQVDNLHGQAFPAIENSLEQETRDRANCKGSGCIWSF